MDLNPDYIKMNYSVFYAYDGSFNKCLEKTPPNIDTGTNDASESGESDDGTDIPISRQ